MSLWSPDTEAVLVAMSCFRHLCEEADIRCGVDEVSVHNFLPNYNTFMEFASVSNMMSTGKMRSRCNTHKPKMLNTRDFSIFTIFSVDKHLALL